MKFIQTLTSNDMYKLNLYIYKQNKRIFINLIIMALIGLMCTIFGIIGKEIIVVVIGIIGILLSVFVIPNIYKKMIKKSIEKKFEEIKSWEISVTITEEGIYYVFTDEDITKVDPYIWGDITYAKSYNDYIIIQINIYTFLLIKKSDCSELNELEDKIEKNLKSGIRYFKYNKNM